MSDPVARLSWISQSVVKAQLQGELTLAEQVWVGEERLAAEVIALSTESATIQVYEDTVGLKPGAPVFGTGHPLSATLGPGLLGNVYDGIQRPLRSLRDQAGIYIARGVKASPLPMSRGWEFGPRAQRGARVSGGELLGVVQETPLIEHRVLVPPRVSGELVHIAEEGTYTVQDPIAVVRQDSGEERELTMSQRWQVRKPRPIHERLAANEPLITGQRILDTFFPLARGGPAAIPGGFGTGKTVLQHSLARWSDADVIIYVGCGERGNEMTEVLEDFPELTDPWSGHPLMERTLLIANTSDMPVSARESSIYTGVTIAEYYRDQGYHVALLADSTSRWAQALREISGRLGEMPIEEGYPAYLPSRLSAFYERAGRVTALGGREGSVTLIGAISPPGGDFSEPVTRHTQRFVRCWWGLDPDLANKRHYPAVDWLSSYSLQLGEVSTWWQEQAEDWGELRARAMEILGEESSLQELVQLVGQEALSDDQQWLLVGARLLREGFLQQNAMSPTDAYAVPGKQIALLRALLRVFDKGRELLASGVGLSRLREQIDLGKLIRLRDQVQNDALGGIDEARDRALERLESLKSEQQDAATDRAS